MEVRTVARYNEESSEVEICSTGSSNVGEYKILASACGVTELDLDEIIATAEEAKEAVNKILESIEEAVSRLSEAGVEADTTLLEALARSEAEEEIDRVDKISIKVEKPAKVAGRQN